MNYGVQLELYGLPLPDELIYKCTCIVERFVLLIQFAKFLAKYTVLQ